jgi:hypothetical protein
MQKGFKKIKLHVMITLYEFHEYILNYPYSGGLNYPCIQKPL